jgi:hypothetical protein
MLVGCDDGLPEGTDIAIVGDEVGEKVGNMVE